MLWYVAFMAVKCTRLKSTPRAKIFCRKYYLNARLLLKYCSSISLFGANLLVFFGNCLFVSAFLDKTDAFSSMLPVADFYLLCYCETNSSN